MPKAPVTKFLVFLNVGIHILRLLYAQFDPYSFQHTMIQFGISPPAFWAGAIYQPFTSMFLHFSLIHIGLNMLSLWSLGEAVERTVGSTRFLLLYMVSGLMSALFVIVFQGETANSVTAGASGAIFGVLGALGVFYPRSIILVFFIPMRAWTAVLFFAALSLGFIIYDHFSQETSFFSHIGHLGGLLGGVIYSRLALQLPFLVNELQGEKRSRFRVFRPAGEAMREDELRAAMDELRQERERARSGDGRSSGGAGAADVGHSPDEKPEPFNTVIPDHPSTPASGERRVYFDPATGRFYIQ